MTLARVLRFPDPRLEKIAVNRSALSVASENAVASTRAVQDSVDRALGHVFANNRAGVIRELERIGFENAEKLPSLLRLTALSESGAACPECGPSAA